MKSPPAFVDEVTTGFRLSAGGAQKYLGVVPDMAVFAKSISNGYPMAAVVGRREVMTAADKMFISSTYWSDTIGLRAALTTLQEVQRRKVPEVLQAFGMKLQQQLNLAAEETGCPVRCTGLPVHPTLTFGVSDTALRQKVATLYIQEMAKRGCHGYASFTLNSAQGPAELDQTLGAAREVFSIVRIAIERQEVDQLLECDVTQDAFQRLVR
jgi:glutamate-1-semialdehyde 2,1-aminomutase